MSVVWTDPVERPYKTRKAIIGGFYGLPNMSDPEEVEEHEIYADWLRDYIPPEKDPHEPVSDIYYPIMDALDRVNLEDEPTPAPVVGLLWMGFFWRDMFTNLLPRGSVGIDVVVSNPCSLSFTYRVNGSTSDFRGVGDFHEESFAQYGTHRNFSSLYETSLRKRTYTGVMVDDGFCPIVVSVYPSSVTLATYTTTNRLVFTICSVLIFAFTSLVFILYDVSVERRQKKVMTTAVRAETIVKSLFPDVVRDRLFNHDPAERSLSTGKEKSSVGFKLMSSKSRIQSFLADGSDYDASEAGDAGSESSPPVADLFPECTVMFADIVGRYKRLS
jgi:hypothetical protein